MRKVAYSLRRRLLGWLLVSTAIIGCVALADTYREAINTANIVSDRVLSGSALAIAERVVVAENGTLEVDIPYVALEMLTSAAQDRVFYRVDGPNGQFLTGYQNLPSVNGLQGDSPRYMDGVFRGEPIRIAGLRRFASTGINSVPFTVTVAETTIARSRLARAIILRSALRLLLMILGAAAIVWVAVTISLRPLYRLSEAIDERSPDDLHPIKQSVPVEVENLVETVNSFMVRLQSALDALRHFTGNASHQLRTPLAIIRTQLALAARAQTLEEAKAAAKKGDASVAHAEHILAQPATVEAEPLLLRELLGNLISNAIAYAGRGSEITVRVRKIDGSACLEVEDNGIGIPAEKRAVVRQRFARGEGNVAPGAGLGLAIVEEIATLFKAELVLEDGAGGQGLKASIRF